MPKTLYLIDGSGFIFRAYHALPPLTAPDGTPVGAVLGFTNMLLRLMEGHKSDYFAVIFDAGRTTFRSRIYPEYKANRPPPPDDLIPQFALVRNATRALNLPAIELADFEADDIIATYAREGSRQGMDVVIVSSDKDLMQLVGGSIRMFDAMKQRDIGPEQVVEKFGVPPEKVREVLALMGDSSDNVPGVPGIGPKTAAELINQYGSLEALLASTASIKQPKRRETLEQNIEKARLSYELIGLKDDVPLPHALGEFALKSPEPEVLQAFLQKHGFKSLLAKVQKNNVEFKSPSPAVAHGESTAPSAAPLPAAPLRVEEYSIVRDEATLAQWIAAAVKKGAVAFDTETTSLTATQAELVGFSLCSEEGKACYVPLKHQAAGSVQQAQAPVDLFSVPMTQSLIAGQIPLARAIALIKPLLEDDSVLKIGHNIKYDMLVMRGHGIIMHPIDDSMLVSYALHAGEHGQGMDELAERYLNHKTITFDEVTGTGKNRLRFDEVEIEKAGPYAAEDADITLRLYHYFKPQLFAKHLLTLHETIERPLVDVLARMETAGILVDTARLVSLSGDFAVRMAALEKEIHALAGYEFNVASPKQLGEVLFDKMQLEGGRKSAKTGAYSTDNQVLEDLAEQGVEIAAKIIEWRQLAKLKSTYSDTLPQQINPATGRVHTNFAQAIASTGRLSSNDPNLQNIPIRSVEGKKIREAFIARPGYVLLSADYSQIELRLLAHIADIGVLKAAFKNKQDIHAITASQMFGVPVENVDSELRRRAKTINFGIIYGISAHGLAARLGIGRSEAGAYIGQYFAQYPGIAEYMEKSKEFARAHGYVETLFGRRCHLPGINDKNGARRQFSERAAINAPLQGTAADIIKRAMIAVDRALCASGLDARMLLQVHDELVFEVRESDLAAVEALAKRHMEHAADLSVPLTVETGSGKHWGEAH